MRVARPSVVGGRPSISTENCKLTLENQGTTGLADMFVMTAAMLSLRSERSEHYQGSAWTIVHLEQTVGAAIRGLPDA